MIMCNVLLQKTGDFLERLILVVLLEMEIFTVHCFSLWIRRPMKKHKKTVSKMATRVAPPSDTATVLLIIYTI